MEDLRGKQNLDSCDFSSEDLVKCTDIAAALIRVGAEVCLAVIEIAAFEKGEDRAHRLSSVRYEELESSKSNLAVVAQVLEMLPRPTIDLDRYNDYSLSPSPSGGSALDMAYSDEELVNTQWEWTRRFLRISQHKGEDESATQQSSHRDYSLTIPGFLVYPLGPSVTVFQARQSEDSTFSPLSEAEQWLSTWVIPSTQLEDVLTRAWDALLPESEDILANIEHLPRVLTPCLPYKDAQGMYSVEVLLVTYMLTKLVIL